ncbi:MAG: cyclase family protein, partial [Alphaproteobacteria bacterium]
MCDKAKERGLGWRGWMPLPARHETKPLGPWLDLTHPIDEAMPSVPTFGPPKVKKIFCLPADPLTVTSFEMVVHTGTHVDAPCHFFSDGPSMEQVPL